ncbi:MAG: hypothetical protein R2881_03190 [Eubacteriales bacterium]
MPENGGSDWTERRTIDWLTITQSMRKSIASFSSLKVEACMSDPIIHRDYANEATYDVKTNELTQNIDYWEYAKRVMMQ